jgi:acetyltransferase-like isoleucine patch superfamily enzyme
MGILDKMKFFKRLMDDPELDRLYKQLKERKSDPELIDLENALIRWAGFLHNHSLEYGVRHGMKVGKDPAVEPLVVFTGFEHIEIGDDFVASSFATVRAVDAKIRIGNKVSLGPAAALIGANHGIEPGTPHQDQPQKSAEIVIEDDVWIGAHSIILPGVKIRKGSVIAAGSVVLEDVPENSVAGGVPAKVLRTR